MRVLFPLALMITIASAHADEVSFTQGPAELINPGLVTCNVRGARVSAVGTIASEDGKVWTVPAETNFATATKAADLYNECGGVQLRSLAALDPDEVSVADLGGGEVFTAYIFADNYFELYINGTLVAVDPVVFTPFNSNVVRFRAERPFTVAVMGVDWEENLGLGSEAGRGGAYHPGDAGYVMAIHDGGGSPIGITDSSWKAQTFYTAPLSEPGCLVSDGPVRDSSACPTADAGDGSGHYAAHWDIPAGWQSAGFDDGAWPAAVTFTNDTVGVDNKRAYTNFTDIFDGSRADAEFIWSSNLVLDNLVLMRTTVE